MAKKKKKKLEDMVIKQGKRKGRLKGLKSRMVNAIQDISADKSTDLYYGQIGLEDAQEVGAKNRARRLSKPPPIPKDSKKLPKVKKKKAFKTPAKWKKAGIPPKLKTKKKTIKIQGVVEKIVRPGQSVSEAPKSRPQYSAKDYLGEYKKDYNKWQSMERQKNVKKLGNLTKSGKMSLRTNIVPKAAKQSKIYPSASSYINKKALPKLRKNLPSMNVDKYTGGLNIKTGKDALKVAKPVVKGAGRVLGLAGAGMTGWEIGKAAGQLKSSLQSKSPPKLTGGRFKSKTVQQINHPRRNEYADYRAALKGMNSPSGPGANKVKAKARTTSRIPTPKVMNKQDTGGALNYTPRKSYSVPKTTDYSQHMSKKVMTRGSVAPYFPKPKMKSKMTGPGSKRLLDRSKRHLENFYGGYISKPQKTIQKNRIKTKVTPDKIGGGSGKFQPKAAGTQGLGKTTVTRFKMPKWKPIQRGGGGIPRGMSRSDIVLNPQYRQWKAKGYITSGGRRTAKGSQY